MKNFEAITLFKYNHYVVNKNLAGFTNEDSLAVPQFGGNCVNWIMGHVIFNRDSALETAGLEKLCSSEFGKLYEKGGTVLSLENAFKLSDMLGMFNKSQELLMKKFEETDFGNETKKMEWFIGLGFHEAYHAGQIGILRRVLGKDGKVN